jgi:FixJ family two-component response regulator
MTYPAVGTDLVSHYPSLRDLVSAMVGEPPAPGSQSLPTLTERIVKVLDSVGEPMTTAEIAERLGTSQQNVCTWCRLRSVANDVVRAGVNDRGAQLWRRRASSKRMAS